MDRLTDLYREAASQCKVAGLPIDGERGGEIARWVAAHCNYRPDTLFFIVLGVCAEMADMDAQAEGFDGQAHRAAELAWGSATEYGEK